MISPWKKQILHLDKQFGTVVTKYKAHFEKELKLVRDKVQMLMRSEQIKHNRLEQRLVALETCFAEKLSEYHEENLHKELRAAQDATATLPLV
jgi:hypothetical protein